MEKTRKAIEVFNQYALQYQEKFMDFHLYDSTFDSFCSAITKNKAKILELGCGPGNITNYLLQKRPDFQILGTDLALKMIELAQINCPQADFKILDCRAIDSLNERFDGIMSGFCLPYLSKEDSQLFIKNANSVLKENGILYISTMEGDYSKSTWKGPSSGDGPKAFIHYHEASYLLSSLKENGFNLIHEIRKTYPEADENTTADLILIAKKI